MDDNESLRTYKLVTLGAGGVGKSAIVLRYVCDEFVEEYDPTIEDTYRKEENIDGATVVLDILDTAGQEEFRSMQEQWIKTGEGFFLVYDITQENSFTQIEPLENKIRRAQPDAPVLLIGNKSDLAHTSRIITEQRAQTLAEKFKCKHLEVSAKDGSKVDEAFMLLVQEIRLKKKPNKKPKRKFCLIL